MSQGPGIDSPTPPGGVVVWGVCQCAVRSCSPVTDPPRSNQARFEVACITKSKSKNLQHAIRLANTMVFSA